MLVPLTLGVILGIRDLTREHPDGSRQGLCGTRLASPGLLETAATVLGLRQFLPALRKEIQCRGSPPPSLP